MRVSSVERLILLAPASRQKLSLCYAVGGDDSGDDGGREGELEQDEPSLETNNTSTLFIGYQP